MGNEMVPILPTEVLPNGATVIEIAQRRPSGEWYVFAMWLKGGGAEYVSWWLDPKTLATETGYYRGSLMEGYGLFLTRIQPGAALEKQAEQRACLDPTCSCMK